MHTQSQSGGISQAELQASIARSKRYIEEIEAKQLADFIAAQKLEPEFARQETAGLCDAQMYAMVHLYHHGLRRHHVLSWKAYDGRDKYFMNEHKDTLIHLMTKENLSPEQAIQEITGVHEQRVSMLQQLYKYGLRGAHLRSWYPADGFTIETFDTPQQNALIYLMTQEKLDATQAIQEVSGLETERARALLTLYSHGLRGEHLRSWQRPKDCSSFSRIHGNALSDLIKEHHKLPEAAVQRISGLTSDQILLLAKLTKQPSEIVPSKGGMFAPQNTTSNVVNTNTISCPLHESLNNGFVNFSPIKPM
jgi:hypothetical protein